jgi:hypothetical protein
MRWLVRHSAASPIPNAPACGIVNTPILAGKDLEETGLGERVGDSRRWFIWNINLLSRMTAALRTSMKARLKRHAWLTI